MTIVRDRPRYDEDYYLWTQDQASRLRALVGLRANEPLDWELLAEEIEALGRNDYHSCCSWIELIVAHLLKLEHSRLDGPQDHWSGELVGFRTELERHLTKALANELRAQMDRHYRLAVKRATAGLTRSDPGFAARLPVTCPYSWAQVTGDWWPEERQP